MQREYVESLSTTILLHDVRKSDMLSQEEINMYIEKAQQGDIDAQQIIVEANLRFVISIARRYLYSKLSLGDMVSEGCLGLIDAIHHFDASRGVIFISYAGWWVRQKITNALYATPSIRLPISCSRKISRIKRAQRDLAHKGLRNRADDEYTAIASRLNMKKKHVKKYLHLGESCLSLDAEYPFGGDSGRLQDLIAESTTPCPESTVILEDEKQDLYNIIAAELNEREVQILCYRFGLGEFPQLTLKELSKKFRITQERVRQIEIRAIEKIRKRYKVREFIQLYQPVKL